MIGRTIKMLRVSRLEGQSIMLNRLEGLGQSRMEELKNEKEKLMTGAT
jgi:hypothetical protein